MAQSQYGGRSDQSDKAMDLKDQATGQIKKVAGQVEGYASDAMDKLRDTGAGEVAGNLKGAVDKSAKDQPMQPLHWPRPSASSSARSGNRKGPMCSR
jgi:hypothetical protein